MGVHSEEDLFYPSWLRGLLQQAVILLAKPYIRRELPGWGKMFSVVAGSKRDWFWSGSSEKIIKGKLHGYTMHLTLDRWPDRSAFFLDRWYDLETQLILRDLIKPGATVVDVGANRGMFALAASRLVGEAGKVVCFEPNPNCLSLLNREIEANGIRNIFVYPCGLGDCDIELSLTVPFSDSGSGTLGEGLFGQEIAAYRVKVPVRVGDQMLACERPALIKIDVEGFEEKVLTGLSETLRKYRPVVLTEVFAKALTANGSSRSTICETMSGFGYLGFRVALEKMGGRYGWTLIRLTVDDDCHFDAAWFHESALAHIESKLR